MSSKPFGSLAPWSEPAWSQGIPSPYYNDSHRKLRDSLRAYINENILPYSLDWEAKGEAPRDEALKWARSGFCFADVPHPYRSKDASDPAGIPVDELDVFHTLISTDETSRVEGGVMTSLGGASVIGIPPVIHHGTDEQQRKWLPGLASWETSFCLGITEPSGGSDVANIQTTAIKSPDGKFYIVNGWKKWITGAPWATCMTTAVRTGGAGLGGISVLVIAMDSPGLSWRRIPNSGQNAGGASLVELDEVKVPVENLLGIEGQGFRTIMVNFNRERHVEHIPTPESRLKKTDHGADTSWPLAATAKPAPASPSPSNTPTRARPSGSPSSQTKSSRRNSPRSRDTSRATGPGWSRLPTRSSSRRKGGRSPR